MKQIKLDSNCWTFL